MVTLTACLLQKLFQQLVSPNVLRTRKIDSYALCTDVLMSRKYSEGTVLLLVSGPASKQSTNLYDIYLTLCVQSWTPDDRRKDRPKHVE